MENHMGAPWAVREAPPGGRGTSAVAAAAHWRGGPDSGAAFGARSSGFLVVRRLLPSQWPKRYRLCA